MEIVWKTVQIVWKCVESSMDEAWIHFSWVLLGFR